MRIISAIALLLVLVSSSETFGENSQRIRRSLSSGKCLVDNPANADRPLCFIDGKQVDVCSNKGCRGCCGSKCSWVGTYCNEVDGVVAKCPAGYTQVGTLSENNDIGGPGLGQSQQDSIADCKNLCENDPMCVAFMYGGKSTNGPSKKCELSKSVTPNNSWGTNFRFCRKTVRCLQENPDNANKPLCFLNEVHQDTCSNKGCNGCCGSKCSWIKNYCSDRIVAECPTGYKQVGTLSTNNDVGGAGLGQTEEDSIEDCQALCESTEGCVAFMYGGLTTVHSSKKCELSSTATPNNSWGSNFRFCQRIPTHADNVVEEKARGVGGWGGSCTCPDGSVYQVGDNYDYCDSLACNGGISGACNKVHGEWSYRKVTCGAPLDSKLLNTAFVQGPKTGCEPGYMQPSSAEDCKTIAAANGIRYWGGAGHRSGADPRGCIYRTPDKDIYFNTHKTGSTNRGDRRTVCVQAFVQGPKTGCEPGYVQPKTAEECKALAEASNIRYWGGAGHRSGADPRGCIYRTPDKDIYFNTHQTGSTNRGDRRTVCVRGD